MDIHAKIPSFFPIFAHSPYYTGHLTISTLDSLPYAIPSCSPISLTLHCSIVSDCCN